MTTIGEWTTVDKSSWGPGAWQDEPDKIHWIDPATDLDCLMHRGPQGNWCGYVAVTEGHPYFGERYSDAIDADAHGGLTFAGFCAESENPSKGICHVPQPGRPDRVWWLGFDCGHAYDLSPAIRALYPGWPLVTQEVYRDRTYVEREVTQLAAQLAAVQS